MTSFWKPLTKQSWLTKQKKFVLFNAYGSTQLAISVPKIGLVPTRSNTQHKHKPCVPPKWKSRRIFRCILRPIRRPRHRWYGTIIRHTIMIRRILLLFLSLLHPKKQVRCIWNCHQGLLFYFCGFVSHGSMAMSTIVWSGQYVRCSTLFVVANRIDRSSWI